MPARKGHPAPVFSLPDGPGHQVDLSTVIGRRPVVLLFFPLAFSPVCTEEMCTFRDDWSKWADLGCEVFGISVDSPFVVKKFREEMNLPFPVLSDFNKVVCKQYGALHRELFGMKGVAKRAAFVIDASGTVCYRWVSQDPRNQVKFDAIRRAVKKAGVPAAPTS